MNLDMRNGNLLLAMPPLLHIITCLNLLNHTFALVFAGNGLMETLQCTDNLTRAHAV